MQIITNGDDDGSPNTLEYPSGDDHPDSAGNLKASGEFVPLLNYYYKRWKLDMAARPPMPHVSANDAGGTVTVAAGSSARVAVSLSPNNMNGIAADWWVLAETPFGLCWYTLDRGWVRSDGPIRVYDGLLFPLSNFLVADGVLPAGTYRVYFAVDNNRNGAFDATSYAGGVTLLIQ